MNVTWTPTDGQSIEIFCFKATNKLNYATPNYCVTLVVGAHAVSFYDPIPLGLVFPNLRGVKGWPCRKPATIDLLRVGAQPSFIGPDSSN